MFFLKNYKSLTSSILIPLHNCIIKNNNVVKIVITTPIKIGISKRIFKAMAVPNTSSKYIKLFVNSNKNQIQISAPIIAISAIIHKAIETGFGRYSLFSNK